MAECYCDIPSSVGAQDFCKLSSRACQYLHASPMHSPGVKAAPGSGDLPTCTKASKGSDLVHLSQVESTSTEILTLQHFHPPAIHKDVQRFNGHQRNKFSFQPVMIIAISCRSSNSDLPTIILCIQVTPEGRS